MRRRIGIIALILAVALLAAVLAIRSSRMKSMFEADRRYEAALYYAHIMAVDSTTSEPIAFRLGWDPEEISPFGKGEGPLFGMGEGPTVVENLPDGSKVLSVVGIRQQAGLRVEVMSEGFQSVFIEVQSRGSGELIKNSSLLQTVPLSATPPSEETQ